MGNLLLIILFFAALVVAAVLMTRRRRDQKQCPECGAFVHVGDEVCRHCGYRFDVAD